MKLRRCDWVPLSVANWLCEELDKKGIPGTTYSHTLLSLLHPYFCPHPVPKDPNHSSKCLVQSQILDSFLETEQTKDFETLLEELKEHVHPDADFPHLNFVDQKKSGSKKAKKKLKRKLQEFASTPEKLWKEVARQCLSSASDDSDALNVLIEELFKKLKNSKELTQGEEIDSAFSDSSECQSDFEPKINSSHPNATYCITSNTSVFNRSNFPPLATPPFSEATYDSKVIDWNALIKNKLSPQEQYRQPIEISSRVLDTPKDVKRNLQLDFCMVEKAAHKLAMEIGPGDPFNEIPQLELKTSQFAPIINSDHFYATDPSYDDVFESSQESQSESLNQLRETLEGWECAPTLPSQDTRQSSSDLLGSRLFERSALGSTNTTRCNSISDIDDDRMKNKEKYVSDSTTDLWGDNRVESWNAPEMVWGVGPSHNVDPSISQVSNAWAIPDHNNWSTQTNNNLNSLPLSKSWSANCDWSSRALLNSINDPFMSSAVKIGPLSDVDKMVEPCEFRSKQDNLKDIWSDYNENNNVTTRGSSVDHRRNCVPESDQNTTFQKDGSQERLCESFRSLGLEHLWQDSLSRETVVPSSFNVLPSIGKQSSGEEFQRERLHIADELYNVKRQFEEEIDPKYFSSAIPSGPNGPYVQLKHTESSGFSTVVPHKTCEVEGIPDELQFAADQAGRMKDDPEEENLLTSPRTHFRPIRQDSNGSTHEDGKSEENQAILNVVSGIQDSDLVFQRTDSGLLFLESDLLHGSPNKYMVYREPSVKPNLDANSELTFLPIEQQQRPNSSSFVPKFKIVNNEKFCQTDEGSSFCLAPILDQKLGNSFQNNKDRKTSGDSIWNSDQSSDLKKLWAQDPTEVAPKKEAWEVAITEPSLTLPKWSTNDLNSINWSETNLMQNFSLGSFDRESSKSKVIKQERGASPTNTEDSFSKMKFIWNDLPNKNPLEEQIPSCEVNVDPTPYERIDDNIKSFPGIKKTLNIDANPWNMESGLDNTRTNERSKKSTASDPLWRLQWEVDQEADVILGELPTARPTKSPNSFNPELKPIDQFTYNTIKEGKGACHEDYSRKDNFDFSQADNFKLVEKEDFKDPYDIDFNLASQMDMDFTQETNLDLLRKRNYKFAKENDVNSTKEADDLNFTMESDTNYTRDDYLKYSSKEDLNIFEGLELNQSVEDLDRLEPGWDLNEGFEWGPPGEDNNGDEEEREVFIYENEDGQTVMVPVEYIDDSLYDEIFGSEANIPIGGSLPDLPHGHMAEWKKLSRRSKGTRFVPPSRRPCSFFLEGNCRRSDCKFSHDLLTITCRFWEEGSCLKGDTCPFRHGVAPKATLNSRPRRRNRSEGDQTSILDSFNFSLKEGNPMPGASKSRPIPKKNRGMSSSMSAFEIDSESDFPCLGSSVESKSGGFDETSLGEAIKATKKKKKLIAVTKAPMKDCDVDIKLGSKGSRSDRRKAKNLKISDASNGEIINKRVARDKEKIECESLRKILRKRHVTVPYQTQSPNRHEDGTLSDF